MGLVTHTLNQIYIPSAKINNRQLNNYEDLIGNDKSARKFREAMTELIIMH
jgi:hypothetical protein